jgi:Mg2+ and Co2+ transporter CorA
VTSLGLGLVALLGLCWVPALSIVTLFVAPPAVILGLFGRRSVSPGDKVMSLLGIYTGTLAILVSVVMIAIAAQTARDGVA